ncbi:hypothetical protein BDV98DRAFT_586468 [Pterulicium gracile]|uniref:Uncharacterized protein n=1 Tax=Pterulicium gracile TaxID=1884261 RepID=A0A5C3Q2F1_9AGAR|nr:hypothetical protein BDV98DRAFT_586468 [Pterula gracilis]
MPFFSSSKSATDSAASSEPLQAVPKGPLSVIEAFAAHDQPITLQLQEGVDLPITGDSFLIGSGLPPVHPPDPTHHVTAEIVDLQGPNTIPPEEEGHGTGPYSRGFPDDDSKVLFTVKKGFTLGKSKLTITFRNAVDEEDTTLALRGNFYGRSATISLGNGDGPVVGRISRDRVTTKGFASNTQMYFLTVALGVDASVACGCLYRFV